MKKTRILAALAAIAFATSALAYQVTGEVADVSPTSITVKATGGKNKGEKFEMARTADTKVSRRLSRRVTRSRWNTSSRPSRSR